MRVTVNGVNLNVAQAGSGERAFVFMHFWGGSSREWSSAALRDELAPSGITVQTINPGAYDTGFNDRLADTTYHWHDDAVHLTKERDIRANFAPLLKGQFDPQEMLDKMVEVIGAEEGPYRNVWPSAVETLIKQVQERTWTLRTNGGSEVEMQRGEIA